MNDLAPVPQLTFTLPDAAQITSEPVLTSGRVLCVKCGLPTNYKAKKHPGHCEKCCNNLRHRDHYEKVKDLPETKSKRKLYWASWYIKAKSNPQYIEKNRVSCRERYHRARLDPVKVQIHRDQRTRAHRKIKMMVYEKLGNVCSCCGESRLPVLSIDHKNGDGWEHRKRCGTSHTYYKSILDDTTGAYQILCMNCQWMKRHLNKEYKKRKPRLISEPGPEQTNHYL